MAAPTKPRKTAAKKPTAAARAKPAGPGAELSDGDLARIEAEVQQDLNALGDDSPIGPDGEVRPVIIGRTGRTGPEMQHVFTLDEVDYFIPKRPSPAIMLKFLREARDKRVGREAAVENAMLDLLGKSALDALAESPDVDDEDCAKVFTIVAHTLFGAVARWSRAAAPPRAG